MFLIPLDLYHVIYIIIQLIKLFIKLTERSKITVPAIETVSISIINKWGNKTFYVPTLENTFFLFTVTCHTAI